MKKNETEIIKSWVNAYTSEYESSTYESNVWAVDYLIELGYDNPEKLLSFVTKILSVDSSEKVKLHIGAGALQDIVNGYSNEYFEKLINMAGVSADFSDALKNVIVDKKCNEELAEFVITLKNEI